MTEPASSQHEHHASGPISLGAEVRRRTGLNPARCMQCGKCSAGCPMAEEMSLKPHQMLRLLQVDLPGHAERLLSDESPWLCLTCETCSSRCPNDVDPARQIDAVREIALGRDPSSAPRRIRAMHAAFLDQIHTHGRVFEIGLIANYKLRSGALLDDVTAAPGMLRRGKLALAPKRISPEGRAEIRRIFDACREAGRESTNPDSSHRS